MKYDYIVFELLDLFGPGVMLEVIAETPEGVRFLYGGGADDMPAWVTKLEVDRIDQSDDTIDLWVKYNGRKGALLRG